MLGIIDTLHQQVADVLAASNVMKDFITPVMIALISLGSLGASFFLVYGGIQYIISSGKPSKLDYAKRIIRNALLGLVVIVAAATLTAVLNRAYSSSSNTTTNKIPSLVAIEPAPVSSGVVDILVKAITGLFQNIIESAAGPFIKALDYFTHSTPYMAENPSVFRLWLILVGMTDSLFVLVLALMGFHIMSYASFGFEELDLKHILPQCVLVFLLINTSIFAVDAVISLSNVMIRALEASSPSLTVWQSLSGVTEHSGAMSLVSLLIMVVFMTLSVILLVYYVSRLVALYVGAILSPIIFLLWLIPSLKDFAATAAKSYVTTIFVLFVHVIILQLSASIFGGMIAGSSDHSLNPLMATVVGVATILSLLKAQKMLTELSYVSVGPKAIRKLGQMFINGATYMSVRPATAIRDAK